MQADQRPPPQRTKDRMVPVISIIAMLGIAGGLYYYWIQREQPAPPATPQTAAREQATPAPEPEIRYPIQRPPPERAKPLPPLTESDAAVQEALAGLIDKESLKRFLHLDSIIRRIIVTVDNLPRDKIPQRYILAKPVAGSFQVIGKDENLAIKPENTRRYTPYVRLFEAIDTKKLVTTYVYFYPLLQEEYKNIGSPKQYFNDRVVEAIDDLLAAPHVKEPIKLVRPKVFYEFADPALEARSAGQKLMIRMGGENAAQVKTKLREIRGEIIAIR